MAGGLGRARGFDAYCSGDPFSTPRSTLLLLIYLFVYLLLFIFICILIFYFIHLHLYLLSSPLWGRVPFLYFKRLTGRMSASWGLGPHVVLQTAPPWDGRVPHGGRVLGCSTVGREVFLETKSPTEQADDNYDDNKNADIQNYKLGKNADMQFWQKRRYAFLAKTQICIFGKNADMHFLARQNFELYHCY